MPAAKLNIALPVAHRPVDSGTYLDFYNVDGNSTQNAFQLLKQFSKSDCKGLRLGKNPNFSSNPPTSIWHLYALTDSFLSFQGSSLVLRLPHAIQGNTFKHFNSANLMLEMSVSGNHTGPQLRHLIYHYTDSAALSTNTHIKAHIRNLLQNAQHPGRQITRVATDQSTSTLGAYLQDDTAQKTEELLEAFFNGTAELFVQAGDLIANFEDTAVELRFKDSCGNSGLTNTTPSNTPLPPRGREINPAFFLHQFINKTATVNLLTAFEKTPQDLSSKHPILDLLSNPSLPEKLKLNLDKSNPPPPSLFTENLPNNNPDVVTRSIKIGTLGEFHESLNASNPFATLSALRWRYYGNQSGDDLPANFCKFRTTLKSGFDQTLLPGNEQFHQHDPGSNNQIFRHLVRRYWARYAPAFNAVASAFEIPCEILVAIACKETGWTKYCKQDFDTSEEANITRLEPIKDRHTFSTETEEYSDDDAIAEIAKTLAPNYQNKGVTESMIEHFLKSAGVGEIYYAQLQKTVTIKAGSSRAFIPVPWSDARSFGRHQLTWGELATLVGADPELFRNSPGVAQTLIQSGIVFAINWCNALYGSTYIESISADFVNSNGNTVTLRVPKPNSSNPKDLLTNWYGINVDSNGNTVAANSPNADNRLTKQQRALHCLITTGLQIKRRYNTVQGSNKKYNIVTDFDLLTLASGYNDGGGAPAKPALKKPVNQRELQLKAIKSGNQKKKFLNYLYLLRFHDGKYPDFTPKFFNAITEYFNGQPEGYQPLAGEDPVPDTPTPSIPPSVRLCP